MVRVTHLQPYPRCPLNRRLGWPKSRSRRCGIEKICCPARDRTQVNQSAARRYTYWANAAHSFFLTMPNIKKRNVGFCSDFAMLEVHKLLILIWNIRRYKEHRSRWLLFAKLIKSLTCLTEMNRSYFSLRRMLSRGYHITSPFQIQHKVGMWMKTKLYRWS